MNRVYRSAVRSWRCGAPAVVVRCLGGYNPASAVHIVTLRVGRACEPAAREVTT